MSKRETWLSITPEPERELPLAVATLARGRRPTERAVAAEREAIEALILHRNQRRWRAYLRGVRELIEERATSADADVAGARVRAQAVITNYDNLLLGLAERAGTTRHRGTLHDPHRR